METVGLLEKGQPESMETISTIGSGTILPELDITVNTLAEFITILATRERFRPAVFTVPEVLKRWFSQAAAEKILTRRAVWIAPVHTRIFTGRNFPEKVHRFVLVSTYFNEDIVSFVHKATAQLELWHSPDSQEASKYQLSLLTEIQAQLEDAIDKLGLSVPVLVGTLTHHKVQGNGLGHKQR